MTDLRKTLLEEVVHFLYSLPTEYLSHDEQSRLDDLLNRASLLGVTMPEVYYDEDSGSQQQQQHQQEEDNVYEELQYGGLDEEEEEEEENMYDPLDDVTDGARPVATANVVASIDDDDDCALTCSRIEPFSTRSGVLETRTDIFRTKRRRALLYKGQLILYALNSGASVNTRNRGEPEVVIELLGAEVRRHQKKKDRFLVSGVSHKSPTHEFRAAGGPVDCDEWLSALEDASRGFNPDKSSGVTNDYNSIDEDDSDEDVDSEPATTRQHIATSPPLPPPPTTPLPPTPILPSCEPQYDVPPGLVLPNVAAAAIAAPHFVGSTDTFASSNSSSEYDHLTDEGEEEEKSPSPPPPPLPPMTFKPNPPSLPPKGKPKAAPPPIPPPTPPQISVPVQKEVSADKNKTEPALPSFPPPPAVFQTSKNEKKSKVLVKQQTTVVAAAADDPSKSMQRRLSLADNDLQTELQAKLLHSRRISEKALECATIREKSPTPAAQETELEIKLRKMKERSEAAAAASAAVAEAEAVVKDVVKATEVVKMEPPKRATPPKPMAKPSFVPAANHQASNSSVNSGRPFVPGMKPLLAKRPMGGQNAAAVVTPGGGYRAGPPQPKLVNNHKHALPPTSTSTATSSSSNPPPAWSQVKLKPSSSPSPPVNSSPAVPKASSASSANPKVALNVVSVEKFQAMSEWNKNKNVSSGSDVDDWSD